MAIALGLTGWWMYIDVPETPNAVVVCVIVLRDQVQHVRVCHVQIDLMRQVERDRKDRVEAASPARRSFSLSTNTTKT